MATVTTIRAATPSSIESGGNPNGPISAGSTPTSCKEVLNGGDCNWTTKPSSHDVCFGRAGVKHAGTMRWWDDVAEAWGEFGSFSDDVVAFIREKDSGRRYWICAREGSKTWMEATPKQIRERTFQRYRHETRKREQHNRKLASKAAAAVAANASGGGSNSSSSNSSSRGDQQQDMQVRMLQERVRQKQSEINSLSGQRDRLLSTIETLNSEIEAKDLQLEEQRRREEVLKTCIMQLLAEQKRGQLQPQAQASAGYPQQTRPPDFSLPQAMGGGWGNNNNTPSYQEPSWNGNVNTMSLDPRPQRLANQVSPTPAPRPLSSEAISLTDIMSLTPNMTDSDINPLFDASKNNTEGTGSTVSNSDDSAGGMPGMLDDDDQSFDQALDSDLELDDKFNGGGSFNWGNDENFSRMMTGLLDSMEENPAFQDFPGADDFHFRSMELLGELRNGSKSDSTDQKTHTKKQKDIKEKNKGNNRKGRPKDKKEKKSKPKKESDKRQRSSRSSAGAGAGAKSQPAQESNVTLVEAVLAKIKKETKPQLPETNEEEEATSQEPETCPVGGNPQEQDESKATDEGSDDGGVDSLAGDLKETLTLRG